MDAAFSDPGPYAMRSFRLDCGRRTTQLMRDSPGSAHSSMTSARPPIEKSLWTEEDLLDSAVAPGFHPYDFIRTYDPLLDPVRAHPRFAGVVEAARQRWEALSGASPLL